MIFYSNFTMNFSAFYLTVISLLQCSIVCLSMCVTRYKNLKFMEDFYQIQRNANLHQETVVSLDDDKKESICRDAFNSQLFKNMNMYYLDRRKDEAKNFIAAYKQGKEFNRHYYINNNNQIAVNYKNFVDLNIKIYKSVAPETKEICYLCMGYTTKNGEILLREFYVFHARLVDSYFLNIWREPHTLQLFAFIELTPNRLNLNQHEAEEYYDTTRFNFETDTFIFNTVEMDILKYLSKNDRGRLCLSVFNTPFYESVGITFENNGEDTNNLYETINVPFFKIEPFKPWSTECVTCMTVMNKKSIVYRLSRNFKLHNSVIVHSPLNFGIESIITDIPILSNVAIARTAIELQNVSVNSRIPLSNLLDNPQILRLGTEVLPRKTSSPLNELVKKPQTNSSLTPIQRPQTNKQPSQLVIPSQSSIWSPLFYDQAITPPVKVKH